MDFTTNLKQLFRSCFRNKSLTLINITGLSLGLAIAMFLLVHLTFEFSYDKHFKDFGRVFRILSDAHPKGGIQFDRAFALEGCRRPIDQRDTRS